MSSQPDYQSVSSIMEQIATVGTTLTADDVGARAKLLNLAYRLATSLELPSEAIMRMMWAEPSRTALCKVAIDLKIFEQLKENGRTGLSHEAIAEASGADSVLVGRILKHLAATNIVTEASAGIYGPTSISDSFTEPRYRDGIAYLHDVVRPSFQVLPTYLEQTDYRNPTELTNAPLHLAHETKLPFFDFLEENPNQGSRFRNYMTGYRAGRPNWADHGFFPVSERLTSTFRADTSPVMLVDVAGGLGHDLVELKAKHPDLPGELVLQDLDSIVSNVKDSDIQNTPFKAMVYNFFDQQPVQHARAYHFHSALHIWDDDSCVKILCNTASAMKQGYSSVLIFEMVVPLCDAPWPVTSEDWVMAVLAGKQERTLDDWEKILHGAGLKICKVWSVEMGSESLIEADLA